MPSSSRVIVAGTTPDYIDWITRSGPGTACFVTDAAIRLKAKEPAPPEADEYLADLSDHDAVISGLAGHLKSHGLSPGGVACFDCESMPLAARIAREFSLDYPSASSIANCRDKSASKRIWREKGIDCPAAAIARTKGEVLEFFRTHGLCVVKPLSAAGSELVFRCGSEQEAAMAAKTALQGISSRRSRALYRTPGGSDSVVVEEFASGSEYSCDFLLESGRARVIRLARKIIDPGGPFGTARAYVLMHAAPEGIGMGELEDILARAAGALGIVRSICMVDFIVSDGRAMLLELAPRPGGDCLPFLLKHALGLDMLRATLDFSLGRAFPHAAFGGGGTYVGLRVHAQRAGVLKCIESSRVEKAPGVLETSFIRSPGHLIEMPPLDYDSWLLGHIIFRVQDGQSPEDRCRELMALLEVHITDLEKAA